MNFRVENFRKDTFCIKNGGKNKEPTILWEDRKDCLYSYALIMEDPYSIVGNKVHWYIPIIYNNIIYEGINSENKYGWSGPCPPIDSGYHEYIFTLYRLDKKLDYRSNRKIKSSNDFEKLLKKKRINILEKEIQSFSINV